jgi:hypothetical protein
MTPIIIKTEEAVKQYNIRKRKGSGTEELASSGRCQNYRRQRIQGTNNPDIHRRE